MLRKTKTALSSAILGMGVLASQSAFAARIAQDQGAYWGVVVELLILLAVSVMFLISLIVLTAGGAFLAKDYIFAKSEHDQNFSLWKLILAILISSLLGYPSAAYLLGQDLTTGAAAELNSGDFERADNT